MGEAIVAKLFEPIEFGSFLDEPFVVTGVALPPDWGSDG